MELEPLDAMRDPAARLGLAAAAAPLIIAGHRRGLLVERQLPKAAESCQLRSGVGSFGLRRIVRLGFVGHVSHWLGAALFIPQYPRITVPLPQR